MPGVEYVPVPPANVREAQIAATALRAAAKALRGRDPNVYMSLMQRASYTVEAAVLAEERRNAGLDARGRWIRKERKTGPEVIPGRSHITILAGHATTNDTAWATLCGRSITGGKIEIAPREPADYSTPPPHGWSNVCGECHRAAKAIVTARTAASA